MKSSKFINNCLKILLFLLFFCLISLVIEVSFFNKDFFNIEGNENKPSFDYYWIRHLAIFLLLILLFIIKKKQINVNNLKPYLALFLLLINIIPGIYFLSKFLVLFLSFLLFLYIKSDYDIWRYKRLLHRNLRIIVFFLVLFTLFFPLLLKEGYVYDPLALFTNLPGYRLSPVSGLRETTGAASDLFDAFLPQWNYNYQLIKQGNFPLWRFNKGLGVPIYGQYNHPERLISFIVKPSEALTLWILLKLFLSTAGMFFLLRAIRIRHILCIIGGIAYALSGFIIGWLHGPQSSVSYHIPFLFLFLINYLNSKKIKFLFYFAIWSSLTICSGFLPVVGYSFYAVGLFLVLFYLFDKQRLFHKIKELLKISLFWALGIVAMLAYFFPLYYSAFISKSFDISYRQIGRVFHLSPKYFVNIIFPFYHGWEITPEIRPYVSSILILFLILSLFCFSLRLMKLKGRLIDREKYYISFLLLLIPFTMAMFGLFPFYQISCKLPILNSSPLSRLQSMTCFILVVVGVKGLELFIQSYKNILEFYKRRKHLFLAVTEILFLSSALIAMTSLISDKEANYHKVYPVFILLSFVILAFQLSIFFKKNSVFFLIILLMLVSIETIIQNRNYVPVNKKIHFITEIDTPLIDFVKENSRKYEGVLSFDSNYNVSGTLGNYGIREKIVHEFHQQDYKALIIDTFSKKAFVTQTAPVLESRFTDFTSSFIQLMGVKHLIFRYEFKGGNLPHYYSLVYDRLDGKVYRNRLYKRNQGIFFCKPKYFKPEEKKEVIKSVKFMDYSKYVYIENDKKINLNYKNNMACDIDCMEYTPNKVIYRYQANSDGILTFPEAFDEGWSVTVNGEKTEVLKTNLIFRGVAIKEGKGEIVFTYHVSQLFKILILVGLVSLLFLISLYLYSDKLKKTK